MSEGSGFNFDLCKRNAMLAAKGVPTPRAWSTGTTIAGVIFKVLLLSSMHMRGFGLGDSTKGRVVDHCRLFACMAVALSVPKSSPFVSQHRV